MKYIYFILILAFVLRIAFLNVVPNGLTNDELTGVMNAYALMHSGETLDNVPWWRALFFTSPGNATAEFHSFFLAPIIGVFGLHLWSVRLTNVLAGTITVWMIYLFGLRLSERRPIALAMAVLLAISPWHIFLSRSAFEATFALLWFTCAGYFVLTRTRWAAWGLLGSLFLMFHSYQGMKVSVPLLCIGLLLWGWQTKLLERAKAYVLVGMLLWVVVFTPLFLTYSSHNQRVGELAAGTTMGQRIEMVQQRSAFPLSVSRLVMNKVTFLGYDYGLRLIGYFDVQRLFFGERTDIGYPIYRYGTLHPTDGILLIVGLFAVWQYGRSRAGLLLVLFLAAVAPSVASRSGISYLFRSHATLLVVYSVMGFGLDTLWQWRVYQRLVRVVVSVVLALSLSYFMFLYFGYLPAWGATWFNMQYKLLATYGESLDRSTPFTSVSNDPQRAFLQYAFYFPERISLTELKKQYGQKEILVDNLRFTDDCPDSMDGVVVIDYPRLSCDGSKDPKGALTDAERNWIVYGDMLCGDEVAVFETFVPRWSYGAMSEIRVNNEREMCGTWFYRL